MPLAPTEEMLREARESLPELPAARIERYEEELGLADDVAALLAADPETAAYFERAAEAAGGVEPQVVANWVTGELAAALRQAGGGGGAAESKVEPEALAALVAHGPGEEDLPRQRQDRARALVAEGGDPAAIVEREGLAQISDSGELEAIVAAAVEANPEAAEQIRAGNEKAIGAIVGAVMKETKGRADGGEVNRLIKESWRLSGGAAAADPRPPLLERTAEACEASEEVRRLESEPTRAQTHLSTSARGALPPSDRRNTPPSSLVIHLRQSRRRNLSDL